jgi:hypothetical protein
MRGRKIQGLIAAPLAPFLRTGRSIWRSFPARRPGCTKTASWERLSMAPPGKACR